jgi:hypothetical protein
MLMPAKAKATVKGRKLLAITSCREMIRIQKQS